MAACGVTLIGCNIYKLNSTDQSSSHKPAAATDFSVSEREGKTNKFPAQEGNEWAEPEQIKHTLNLGACQRKQNNR